MGDIWLSDRGASFRRKPDSALVYGVSETNGDLTDNGSNRFLEKIPGIGRHSIVHGFGVLTKKCKKKFEKIKTKLPPAD